MVIKTKKVIKKTVSIISYILMAVLVLLVVFTIYCNATNKLAFIGDRAAIRIVSGSMEDLIPTGMYISVEKIDAKDAKVGDVIVFYSEDPAIYGKLNTHRIVSIDESENGRIFTTKGDNNAINDAYKVKESDVVARYIGNLPLISAVANFISKPIVFLLLIIIPAAVLLFFSTKDIKSGIEEAVHKKRVMEEIEKLKKNGISPEFKSEETNVPKTDTQEKDKKV